MKIWKIQVAEVRDVGGQKFSTEMLQKMLGPDSWLNFMFKNGGYFLKYWPNIDSSYENSEN